MIGKKLISSRILALFELKDLVKERIDANEKGVEPTYEQNMVTDYSKKFVKLSPAKARKCFDELKKIDGVSEVFASKVVDVLPEDLEELNLLIPRSEKVDEAKLKDILEAVKKFRE